MGLSKILRFFKNSGDLTECCGRWQHWFEGHIHHWVHYWCHHTSFQDCWIQFREGFHLHLKIVVHQVEKSLSCRMPVERGVGGKWKLATNTIRVLNDKIITSLPPIQGFKRALCVTIAYNVVIIASTRQQRNFSNRYMRKRN